MRLKTRISAVLLAAASALGSASLVSCGGAAPKKEKLEHVYDYTAVKLDSKLVENGYESVKYHDGRIYFSTYGENEDGVWGQSFTSVDESGQDVQKIVLQTEGQDSYIGQIYFVDDQIWYLETKWNFDESTQTSTAQSWVHKMDLDGGNHSAEDISKYTMSPEGEFNGITALVSSGSATYGITGKRVLVFKDGKVDKAVDVQINGWLNTMFADRSGNIWVSYYEEGSNGTKCKKFDENTGALTDDANLPSVVVNNLYSSCQGPDYDVYYPTSTSLYGYSIGDTEPTEVCNWLNSDISASYINTVNVLSDGRLFVAPDIWSQMQNVAGGSVEAFYFMTKRPDEKNVEKYILTLGCVYLDNNVRTAVSQFNRQSDEYRITIKDYSIYSTEEDWQASYTRLNQDIISGNSPDIITVTEQMPYSSYAAKGIFADLNPYFDKDEEIKREDYLENILNVTSLGGKLYSVVPSFSIQTLACKSSLVKKALGTEDITGINMEEFNKIIAALPDARVFATFGRADFLNRITSSLTEMYVDQETGKCTFDSPDFIALLEFIKAMPEKSVYDDIDYDDYDESVWNDIEMMYINDEAIFNPAYISNYSGYWTEKMGHFGGDMIYVGFPCESRQGAIISAGLELAVGGTSKYKDQAWEFIKYFLKDEYQESIQWQFPLKKSVMSKLADKALNPPKEGDEDWYYGQDTYWIGGQDVKIGTIDKAGIDYVDSYIASITRFYRPDTGIETIITEETDAFFNGAKTAEECAKLIQNRVQTYVSEQR